MKVLFNLKKKFFWGGGGGGGGANVIYTVIAAICAACMNINKVRDKILGGPWHPYSPVPTPMLYGAILV